MESNGKPGKILISENSMEILSTHYPLNYNFEEHKIVEFPKFSRTSIKTYFIN